MNGRIGIYIFILALVALILYWNRQAKPVALLPAAAPFTVGNKANVTPPVASKPAGSVVVTSNDMVDTRELGWQRTIAARNFPVAFYGMVIDQNSNPVSGAAVVMELRHGEYSATDGVYSTSPKTEMSTDFAGRFEWTDGSATGNLLTIDNLTKNGYQLDPNSGALCYAVASGSYGNPVVLKMWKMGEKAHLISGSKFWGIIPDGRVYILDLLQGTKAESIDAVGNLRISVARPAGVARKDRYDWSFQITPIDGGIVESQDEFMYEAPRNGYAPQYVSHMSAADPKWTYHPKMNFYIVTREGQNYGRITVEVFAHYQDAGIFSIDYAVNPTGSRNLQP